MSPVTKETLQAWFDTMLQHLRRQGCRATGFLQHCSGEVCLYRGNNGTMCAVGCLVPGDKYIHAMEGGDVRGKSLEIGSALGFSEHDYEAIEFLKQAQEIHDGGIDQASIHRSQVVKDALFRSNLEPCFKALAFRHGLVYKEPVS